MFLLLCWTKHKPFFNLYILFCCDWKFFSLCLCFFFITQGFWFICQINLNIDFPLSLNIILMFSCVTSQWWCWIHGYYDIIYRYIPINMLLDQAKYLGMISTGKKKMARLIQCNATKTFSDFHFYCFFTRFRLISITVHKYTYSIFLVCVHICVWLPWVIFIDFHFYKTKELQNWEFNVYKCDICCYRWTTCVSNVFRIFLIISLIL